MNMICYLDMVFCSLSNDCASASRCDRVLTPAIKSRAKGLGLPIQMGSFTECFNPKNPKEENNENNAN